MVTSAIIQENILEFLSDGEARSVQEIKAYLAETNVGEYSEGQFAGSMNTLQRNGKIKKNSRGVYTLRQEGDEEDNMKTCFVVSPIGDEGSEIRKKADQLLNHIIKPVCKACGFSVERVDQMNDIGSITQKILDNLENADLVIADIAGHNPNVFFEMGFRARTNKPIIHLRPKGEQLPFDIAAIRAFDYNLGDLDSVEEIKGRLQQTIKSFTFPSHDESSNDESTSKEGHASPSLPILYEILDAIKDLRDDFEGSEKRALRAVIETMQSAQPQMSQEDRLMAQMLPALMQNPEAFMQLAEISEKFPTKQNNKKLRR